MEMLLHPLTSHQLDLAATAPAGTYLFAGPTGCYKTEAARELARRLNCRGDSGGPCVSCRWLTGGNHPNLLVVEPRDRPSLTVEQIRQLQADLSLSNYDSHGQRVVVIHPAEALTLEAQNALLKLIEEPPGATVMILVSSAPDRLLPTVRSRAQTVFFALMAPAAVAGHLQQSGVESALATEAAELAGGAPRLAHTLTADAAQLELYRRLDTLAGQLLVAPLFDRLAAARQLAEAKTPLPVLGERLQQRLRAALRVNPDDQPSITRLESVNRFWRRLQANVTPRVALEGLLLEL